MSGGADSVALLCLLMQRRPDLRLHVVHLDHETRAGASRDDAEFVRDLATRLKLIHTIETRSAIETTLDRVESNRSARFRHARLALFRRVVDADGLAGVFLAHHADDQAETILLRLLRGSGSAGLTGMSSTTQLGGLLVRRPLLQVRRDRLREILNAEGQAWREDASNASDDYLRNQLRRLLAGKPQLTDALIRLGSSCQTLRAWIHAQTPQPGAMLRVSEVLNLPDPLRRELARRWLVTVGVPDNRIEPSVVARLIEMAEDAAAPARREFPGNVLVRRARGVLSVAGVD